MQDLEKIVSLCKRRGFIFPGSEIYGGLAGTWDLGPLGSELAHNIKELWWNHFVGSRDDMFGLASSILMPEKVWEASGHLEGFADPLGEGRRAPLRAHGQDCRDQQGQCSARDRGRALPRALRRPALAL